MYGTAWGLLPPLIAIVLALVTKEVYSSLFAGIAAGALLACGFHPVAAMNLIIKDGFSDAVSGMAGNYCFLVLLGCLIAIISRSGGSEAFGRWAGNRLKTGTGAQLAAFFLGILVFIDDYFNCLMVGSVMRPVTDRYRISRAKLAYLIDATAAPICMIAPVSSWAAAVSGVAEDLGTGMTGIQLFIRSIPYNFYSLLTLVFIFALVCMGVDYGPMRTAQRKARLSGDLGAKGDPEASKETSASEAERKGRTADLVFPVVVLVITVLLAMLYVGGYFGETPWTGTENAGNVIDALGNTDAFIALPWGTLVTLCITIAYFLLRRTIRFRDMMECLPEGFVAMIPSILILTLAASLKTVTLALGANVYIHDLMAGSSGALQNVLPAVIFVVSALLAFATGTSWGTFGILIPIVTAAFSAENVLLYIGVSACLAGAVCGDHCSPISDTTVMSSAGAGVDHIEHVSTQIPYALTVAGICFITYLAAGIVQNWAVCLLIGTVLTVLLLAGIRRFVKEEPL
ncbi:MAG: Na+/H+ antiporter NhaC family protein [Lachnospiraceae bacterium]|nr:Na+/H+ antiporter NhaC family protein [Lachnospiraceae bacterium]